MEQLLLPVIMAGGSGSRLWPLSRTLYPKQFLSLTSSLTMLQETILRLDGLQHKKPLIICNVEHRFLVAEQLHQKNIEHSGIILEPIGRNTAPAVALAALKAINEGEDPLLLVLAADHVIQNKKYFIEAVEQAKLLAEQNKLVTFGIVPQTPETGYGYIKKGEQIANSTFKVDSFVEKPNLETAQKYIESGEYYWNSGMFLFKSSRYLEELKLYCPEMLFACEKAFLGQRKDLDFIRLDDDAFAKCADESIDYAVMEKTKDAVVVAMDAQWSDVGSWSALWEISEKDDCGNACRGDVFLYDVENSFIYSQNKLVSVVGVKDLIVIETKDAILVSDKKNDQLVKKIVGQLKNKERSEHKQHREVFRPWGSYDSIGDGARFQVKQVIVKPGEKTSIQIHSKRAEHWVVVSGSAKVQQNDKFFLINENESIYIPIGVAHSLENISQETLVIIEVRTGDYVGDDDVVRVKDK